jgi:hypothetical protein
MWPGVAVSGVLIAVAVVVAAACGRGFRVVAEE